MGLKFRKSVNLGGGFRINLSKSGMGYSWGTKGYRITKTANGKIKKTYSIPGTGISYTETVSNGNKNQASPVNKSLPKGFKIVRKRPKSSLIFLAIGVLLVILGIINGFLSDNGYTMLFLGFISCIIAAAIPVNMNCCKYCKEPKPITERLCPICKKRAGLQLHRIVFILLLIFILVFIWMMRMTEIK